MMSNWTKEKTLMLIEKIRSSNVWDIKSKEYKDTNKREDIYSSIAEELNHSANEVESKWHTIKSQFSRELSKVLESHKSGTGIEDLYYPSWYAYSSLQFLKDTHRPHINMSTTDKTDDENEPSVSRSQVQQNEDTMSENSKDDDQSRPLSKVDELSPFVLPKKRHKGSTSSPDIQAMVRQMTAVGEKLGTKRDSDEFQIFGDYVASELRKYNDAKYARILAKVKHGINSVLYDAEMEKIEMDRNDRYHSSTSSLPLSPQSPICIATPPGNSPSVQEATSNPPLYISIPPGNPPGPGDPSVEKDTQSIYISLDQSGQMNLTDFFTKYNTQ